ncbi:MAG: hypothetical protein J0L62_11555 [Bacteroidetes bacterium]|nr:hypothetical protein [Bacteroidota bacterium]
MIQIKKRLEPVEWTAKKATPGFTEYEAITELREALLEEQGYICAYCMRRIPAKDVKVDATSKIEHIKSQESRPDLQLSYANMAICCPGNLNDEAHCDKSKGGNNVSFNLHTAALQQSITYTSFDGSISSTNTTWNNEMNDLLNLNHELLKANRKEALSGIIEILNAVGWSKHTINTKLNLWRQRNTEGKYYQFCGIIIWYLEK